MTLLQAVHTVDGIKDIFFMYNTTPFPKYGNWLGCRFDPEIIRTMQFCLYVCLSLCLSVSLSLSLSLSLVLQIFVVNSFKHCLCASTAAILIANNVHDYIGIFHDFIDGRQVVKKNICNSYSSFLRNNLVCISTFLGHLVDIAVQFLQTIIFNNKIVWDWEERKVNFPCQCPAAVHPGPAAVLFGLQEINFKKISSVSRVNVEQLKNKQCFSGEWNDQSACHSQKFCDM